MRLRALFLLLLNCLLALCMAGPPGHAHAASGKLDAADAAPAVAFYYGAAPPWSELQAFDIAVVDPDQVVGPLPTLPETRLAAYVSVGEVHATRGYAKDIPAAWLVGENRAWGSRIIDQTQPGWPAFFVDKVVAPLWEQGYRSFFLDTLDSYQRLAVTPEQRAAQEAGLVAVIGALKQRYPAAQLIFNRGFEILERTRGQVMAVAAESLFQGYDAAKGTYRPVAETDRGWLLDQLKRVREELGLPVIVIDYVPAAQRDLARITARQIEHAGFIPWVATGDLATLGVGQVEVMPRRVMLIHSPLTDEYALRQNPVVRYATMPLNHLGYAPEYVDLQRLPDHALAGRYAGVVLWLTETPSAAQLKTLAAWLEGRIAEDVPVAVINQLDVLLGTPLGRQLGVVAQDAPAGGAPVEILQRDPVVGFERGVRPVAHEFEGVTLEKGNPLLTLGKGKARQVAAAVTPWGGYVMAPYALATLPSEDENRWVIDPFAFFRVALRLPEMPVPDVTTESGRRMLLVHMDGDGFVSRSELPGNPFAGELVRDRVVRKHALPMTISVIEAELSPQGLYPQHSQKLEDVAREIFRAPNVEIASHSYSHPFFWGKAVGATTGEASYNLPIPGYRFDLQREIEGSIRYIETRLAPADKKVAMFLWTGDCEPGGEALEWTRRLGVMNMNGGDTTATRTRPTLTRVEGLGFERNGLFQVFAPNQNENVYTNEWTGPYYGYERVIETFELTEKPRRLKPIDIYFHAYITTRHAGMRSLDKVFAYAAAQEVTPVFASEYARKVLEFPRIVVARSAQGWRVRGMERLRTLRVPVELGIPDLDRSVAVAGYRDGAEGRYVHLAGKSAADLVMVAASGAAPGGVRLVSANGRVEDSQRSGQGYRWSLVAHVPLEFSLANIAQCRVRVAGRDILPSRRDGAISHYRLTAHAARPLEAICQH